MRMVRMSFTRAELSQLEPLEATTFSPPGATSSHALPCPAPASVLTSSTYSPPADTECR